MTDEEHGEAFKMGESFGFDAGYEAGQAAATPHATPADINMLWTVIDELKARIDALENPKRYVPIPTPFAAAMVSKFGAPE